MSWVPSRISFYVSALAFEAYALDMSQFKSLFNSTRIPQVGKDKLVNFPNSKHIVVQRGSQFYRVDVIKEDGAAISDSELHDK
jgi:carnitine O-palmitoyltransferase 2